jgi:hypothetical protein
MHKLKTKNAQQQTTALRLQQGCWLFLASACYAECFFSQFHCIDVVALCEMLFLNSGLFVALGE